MKKVLSIILAAVIAMSAFSFAFAADEAITSFSVGTSSAQAQGELGTVKWWFEKETEAYYLFMPSNADISSVTVWFEAAGDVYVGATKLISGAATTAFANGGEFTLTCGESSYKLIIMTGSEVPALFINTASGSLDAIHADKEYEEAGDMLLIKKDNTIVYDDLLESIKGRGNSTWEREKKPYNIKLASKTNILEMGKSKKWSLIANDDDDTLARNYTVFSIARDADMTFTPDAKPIDLYINSEYRGSFLITTRVQIDDNRVEITDLEGQTEDLNENELNTYPRGGTYGTFSGQLEGTSKWFEIPNNPENITGGYLLEMEIANRYPAEASGFVTTTSQPVVIKGPEFASKEQVAYISEYYQDFEDAVFSDTGINNKGKHYTEYCDLTSLAQVYIVNEWALYMDASTTSSYFYKDADGKMYAGPVWDYDIAIGNSDVDRFGVDLKDPTSWWVCNGRQYRNTIFGTADVLEQPTLFNKLCKHEDFMAEVRRLWDGTFKDIFTRYASTDIRTYTSSIAYTTKMNAVRWNRYSTTDMALIEAGITGEINFMVDFATRRTAFLDANLGPVIANPKSTVNIFKLILVGFNNTFEKMIVTFNLENKLF